LADLDRDGIDAEIVYGCLMINDLIADASIRAWADKTYNDWAADFAKRSDPKRVFPLAIIPNTDPAEAAAEVRRCAKMGLRGGDLSFKRMSPPLYHHGWYPLWEAAAECRFPIAFHSTGFNALRAPDTPEMEKEYLTQWRLVRSSLFQLDTMEVLVSLLASGACEKYPDFNFVLGESGVTWLPYVFDRCDTEYMDRARALGFSLKPSDYFRRQGRTRAARSRRTWAGCRSACNGRSRATTWRDSTTCDRRTRSSIRAKGPVHDLGRVEHPVAPRQCLAGRVGRARRSGRLLSAGGALRLGGPGLHAHHGAGAGRRRPVLDQSVRDVLRRDHGLEPREGRPRR
jgi:predicted TIM-barrel fold metal-dependent hydrolase